MSTFNAQSYMTSWRGFREANERAWAKQSLLHAAAHLMAEYQPATSTLGHRHYCYSGDLAAVELLYKAADALLK
jgi:hypothetical protein